MDMEIGSSARLCRITINGAVQNRRYGERSELIGRKRFLDKEAIYHGLGKVVV
jgi:hypothetical protein